jgi:hypothetical protein
MSAIRGTIHDGKVTVTTPLGWPDGAEVVVKLAAPVSDELPDDDDDSPEAIARRLALMDRVQPWMTSEELAEWERMRAEDKAFQLSQWEKWSKEIEGMFE